MTAHKRVLGGPVLGIALLLSGACDRDGKTNPPGAEAAQGVTLAESKLTGSEAAAEDAGFLRLPYIETSDDTYVGDPTLFLGKLLAVRQENGKCPGTYASGALEALPARVIGMNISAPTKPELKRSILIDRKVAAEIQALSYISASLAQDQVASVTVTDLRSQRVVDDEKYRAALREAKETYKEYYEDDSICYLLIVEGVSHKAILSKNYVKVETEGRGGAYGINIGGSYYSTSEDFQKIDRFGLSLAVVRRPKDKADPIAEKDQLMAEEQEMFSRFSKLEVMGD